MTTIKLRNLAALLLFLTASVALSASSRSSVQFAVAGAIGKVSFGKVVQTEDRKQLEGGPDVFVVEGPAAEELFKQFAKPGSLMPPKEATAEQRRFRIVQTLEAYYKNINCIQYTKSIAGISSAEYACEVQIR